MTFLIARPKEKARVTLTEFNRHGLQGEILPLINIEITQDPTIFAALLAANPNCIIITSSYAAQWFVRVINSDNVVFDLSKIEIICVGNSTAQLIVGIIGVKRILVASPENSEGILKLEYLQMVKGQNIVLLKGQGGRDLIPKTLEKRNANLTVLNVYERLANFSVINAFAFEQSEIKCIIATSVEITELLLTSIDNVWLLSCQWIVASERIKDYAYAHGIKHITVSQGASNQALIDSANQLVNTGVLND